MKYGWLIVLLCLQPILYAQGLLGGFVFDDRFLIVETMGQVSLYDIWFGGLWDNTDHQANFYRPFFSMSIWIDQMLFGNNSFGYHIHSLLWHMLNIVLFAHFGSRLLNELQARIATVIFATHPLLSEVVFWISARNDTMAMTFVLCFLCLLYTKLEYAPSRSKVVALCFVFLSGLLSKESTLLLFIPVLVHSIQYKRIQLLGAMLSIVVVLFGWRYRLGVSTPALDPDNIHLFWSKIVPFMVDGFGRLLFPWRLSPSSPLAWLTVTWWQIGLALCTIGMCFLYIKKTQNALMWITWLIASIVIALPAIIFTGNFGDRYWSLGLIAWSFIFARVVPLKWIWIPVPFWMALIFFRGVAWQSDLNFWEQEVTQYPTPYAKVSLALIQYNHGDLDTALQGFYEGLNEEPPYVEGDGCMSFVSTVLSLEGAQSALEASDWAMSKGCEQNGKMIGLRAVLLAGLGRWDEVNEIVLVDWNDPTRRLDVVRIAVSAREESWSDFCREWDTWSDKDRLVQQLKVLSPIQFENTDWVQTTCTVK